MSKSTMSSVSISGALAGLVAHVREECKPGDQKNTDSWAEPTVPMVLRFRDDVGGVALGLVTGINARRGGPNSNAGSAVQVQMIHGEVLFNAASMYDAEVSAGAVFALRSRGEAPCEIEALSMQDSFRALCEITGIRLLGANDDSISAVRLLGPSAQPKPEPVAKKPAARTGMILVASATSRFSGRNATSLGEGESVLDELERLETPADADDAQG
ncbi:MAG TPA: hypothetical protein PLP33_19680 [Leptospiraceae bacterium]|nr:hypothetical protein [Leptospiraceae bacterium]